MVEPKEEPQKVDEPEVAKEPTENVFSGDEDNGDRDAFVEHENEMNS